MSGLLGGHDAGEVTQLLRAWSDGDADAFDRVLPLVYEERTDGVPLPGWRAIEHQPSDHGTGQQLYRVARVGCRPLAESRALFESRPE
jgi:hypothetical protein